MIVKEKGLLRLMKEAYKGSGYTVTVMDIYGEEHLCMNHWGWKVAMEMDAVPRKVLGLLAEHLGMLPVAEEAFKVSKGDVQRELFDTAKQPFRELQQSMEQWETRKIMRPTKLEWDGCRVWQSPRDMSIIVMDPDLAAIGEFYSNTSDVRIDGVKLIIRGDRSFVAINRGCVSEGDEPMLEHLMDMKWAE